MARNSSITSEFGSAFVRLVVSKRTDLESHPEAVEQFLAMLCFEKRDELAELPIDVVSEFGKGGSR
jgi:hypothetical protein